MKRSGMGSEQVLEERTAIDVAVDGMTLVSVMNRNADRFPHEPAVYWNDGDERRSMSWAGYRSAVTDVAAGLLSLGVGADDFIGIQSGNRAEHVIADIGAVFAAATPVTLYSTLATPQVTYVANHCGVKVAILEGLEFMKRWEAAKPDLPSLEYIVLMEGAENYDTVDWILSWDDLVARGKQYLSEHPDAVADASATVTPEDLATLIYTSGTTGTPKGVMITQRNVVWTTECTARTVDIPDHPRFVSYLPLAHIGERMASHYMALWLAGSVHYVPDLSMVAEAVQQARPQVFFAVPRVWEKFQAGLMTRLETEPNERKRKLALGAIDHAIEVVEAQQRGESPGLVDRLKSAAFDKLVFSKIRSGLGMDDLAIAISAAAPVSADLLTFFRAIGLPVYELYGMTESSGPGVTNRPGSNKIGSVGRAMPGVEIGIADDDEILLRGGLITAGYYKSPESTAETFQEDGWLRTGDLGRLDDDGFLTIIGRKKEIIITAAGKNIAPAKLENLVKQHPLISQACVVGDGRKFLTLLVAIDAEMAPQWAERNGVSFTDLQSFTALPAVRDEVDRVVEDANNQVARVEQAKKWIVAPHDWTPESGELTPSLKLKRRVVLEKYADDIEAMYAG